MTPPTSSPTAQAQAIRDAYAALNRNDVPGFIALFDAEVIRIEPSDFPLGGSFHGLEAVKAHVVKGRSTWAEGGCEPQRVTVAGDRVIAFIHVHVRLKDETQWRDGDIVDIFTFRNGKVIEFRTFTDEREALQSAGIQPPDAP